VITEDDIIDALTKCTAYDSAHTPKPSDIVVEAWFEHFSDFRSVTREDLLLAVKEYYRTPRDVQVQPSHISAIARKYSQLRYEESDVDSPERLAYEAICDSKAMPDEDHAIEAASANGDGQTPVGCGGGTGQLVVGVTSQIPRQDRKAEIEKFAKDFANRPVVASEGYLSALVELRRTQAPAPVPCPDCGALEKCEHDEEESD